MPVGGNVHFGFHVGAAGLKRFNNFTGGSHPMDIPRTTILSPPPFRGVNSRYMVVRSTYLIFFIRCPAPNKKYNGSDEAFRCWNIL